MANTMKYTLKLNLLNLKNAAVTRIKGAQETKLCMVIPIEDNHLYVGDKGVYLDVTAFELRETGRNGDTHLLKQSLPKNAYQSMSEEERRAQPLLGSMKPLESKSQQSYVAASAPFGYAEDNGDLPF